MAKLSSRQRLDFEAPIIELEKKIEELRTFAESTEVDLSGQIEKLVKKCVHGLHLTYFHLIFPSFNILIALFEGES